ncbi:tRNA epoxyqueuosine(34) reductase QueG [Edaphobacter modestus]|uniref:Epoxyqueuosine reductase n=1 Tax=Edaphobacter modestus TaxID=388466 RepID=A0A4Q7YQT0_9BACT|nr:tRNA epoxyqueuosine(34) reductase QueG [Edaphobacter modestus]RZU40027.1 epoxyqueuosine reductase [Edaphobacter modestus]
MSVAWTPELAAWIEKQALETGFDAAGVAPVPEAGSAVAERDAGRFSSWVEAGRAGEMEYLKRRGEDGILVRSAVRAAMPWARSVIVCALNYNAAAPPSIAPAPTGAGWIARYAWSGRTLDNGETVPTDYHEELLGRLHKLEALLKERIPAETRCYVDTGPLVERSMAAHSGLGWIGKNTCVIHQQLGSWLLLGVIVTSISVAPHAVPELATDRCGTCTRCIDACPTEALVAPREMDASRCIAYLTIEKKGEIPEALRAGVGRQVFGCDICQDVCPWNRRAPIAVKQGMEARPELVNPALQWLASLDAAGFRKSFKGSPLERTRRKRLHRNVAIAMGNSHDKSFLSQLEAWTLSEDEVLAEGARWAIRQITESALHD